MKNRTLRHLATVAVAGSLALSGCVKDESVADGDFTGKGLRLVAEKGGAKGTKTTVDGLNVYWASGDKVCANALEFPVYANSAGTLGEVDIDNSTEGILMVYPSSLAGNLNDPNNVARLNYTSTSVLLGLPDFYQYKEENGRQRLDLPMLGKAAAGAGSITLKHICGAVDVTVTNNMDYPIELYRIFLNSNSKLTGRSYNVDVSDMDNFDITPQAHPSNNGRIDLLFEEQSCTIAVGASKTFQIPVLPCNEFSVEVDFWSQIPGVKAAPMLGYQRSSTRGVARATVVNANVILDPGSGWVSHYSEGGFSVAPDRQVCFSQGNLQFQASTGTWRFAENQYDFRGAVNALISPTYEGWIDLFGWGTSGWNSGAVAYQPWSTSDYNPDYHPDNSGTINLAGAYADADWAWHNPIWNGGNRSHMWRTLDDVEWDYLLHNRFDANNKWGLATVNGMSGLILLPDAGYVPWELNFETGINTANNYTLSEWQLFEREGAIFLPAAGHRDGTYYYADHCTYWTSNATTAAAFAGGSMSTSIDITGSSICLPCATNKSTGLAVRPVIDLN